MHKMGVFARISMLRWEIKVNNLITKYSLRNFGPTDFMSLNESSFSDMKLNKAMLKKPISYITNITVEMIKSKMEKVTRSEFRSLTIKSTSQGQF